MRKKQVLEFFALPLYAQRYILVHLERFIGAINGLVEKNVEKKYINLLNSNIPAFSHSGSSYTEIYANLPSIQMK